MSRRILSLEHCDHPEKGCPLAALAPEFGRSHRKCWYAVNQLPKLER
jgi:hypothetical protein